MPTLWHGNIYTEPDPADTFAEKLPENLAKAVGVGLATAFVSPLGLLLGGVAYADQVRRYINGVTITCAGCRRTIKVS